MSTRQSNAVQATLVATIVAAIFTKIFLGGGTSSSMVPSAFDATLATLIVTGPIWYLAFPDTTGQLERAKKTGAVVVFCAVIGMFTLHLLGNFELGSVASATLVEVLALPFTILILATLTCFFFGIVLLPVAAYAAFYLRRYQINNQTKSIN